MRCRGLATWIVSPLESMVCSGWGAKSEGHDGEMTKL
jgi:hypothetical protein